jgi:hypothetical protein
MIKSILEDKYDLKIFHYGDIDYSIIIILNRYSCTNIAKSIIKVQKIGLALMSNISNTSTNKQQSHKRCQHLEKKPIAHFSTFFDEKEKS